MDQDYEDGPTGIDLEIEQIKEQVEEEWVEILSAKTVNEIFGRLHRMEATCCHLAGRLQSFQDRLRAESKIKDEEAREAQEEREGSQKR